MYKNLLVFGPVRQEYSPEVCVCFCHRYFLAVSPLPIQTVRSFITLPPLPLEDDFYFGEAETFLVPFLAVMTVLSLTAVVGLTVFMG